MNSLAIELIDDIIGHVDEDYIIRSHMHSCSLVCRLWLPSSQHRLFHHIKLRHVSKLDAKIQRLDQVLLNSPHLASYIRVLELPDSVNYGDPMYQGQRHPSWIAIEKRLSSLLHKFTHLQKLKVIGLPWNALAGDYRQSLCRVLELPSMAFVCVFEAQFMCMDDFTDFINHARGPIGLYLGHIDTSWVPPQSFKVETKQVEDNKEEFERHRISHLTRLDTGCRSVFVNWLLGPRSHLDVSHIHTLHIHLPKKDDSVNRLLCGIGSSLKHVSIILPHVLLVLVNLAFNVNIEILSLVQIDMGSDTLSTLRKVLSTVHPSNHIHYMELRVDPFYDYNTQLDWAAWDEVYSVLAGPHFQFLRALYINIEVGDVAWNCPHKPAEVVEQSDIMVDDYPLLETRGVRVSSSELFLSPCIFCDEP
ncbi:hypothetical protein JB92DRAFT_2988070 [Gautieria morchelliformis]|nr:hypothetical protein JB92DRAFT_2988070 [Gautieria morchelliformis]